MPRLDETSDETRALIDGAIDVADGNPIDLCLPCYTKIGSSDDVEHPDYDQTDPIYYCALCGDPLCSADN